MCTGRLARSSVLLTVAAGAVSIASGLLAVVWFPNLPDAPAERCTDPPCWSLDLGGASPLLLLPFISHFVLLGLASLSGGLSLLLSLLAAARGRGLRELGVAAVAAAGPLLVLVGGELVPHVLNPCVLPELAGAQPPGFCSTTSEGSDVPDDWHAFDHAVVGFLPLSLLMAWWWRRASRNPSYRSSSR